MSSRGSVYKRGATWTYHFEFKDENGKRRQRKKSGFKYRKDAEEALTRALRSVDTGLAVGPDATTFGAFLDSWLDHREQMGSLATTTIKGYREKIRNYLKPTAGDIPLQKLRGENLNAVYRRMAGDGLATRTIRQTHAIARKALSDAERERLIEDNPAERATPPSTKAATKKTFSVWSDAELSVFLEGVQGTEYGAALTFAAWTGCRRGEVCGVRWEDVDLDAQTVTVLYSVVELVGGDIEVKRTKSGRERVLALGSLLVAELRRHRKAQNEWRLTMGAGWRDLGLVFPGPDGSHLRPDTLSKAFKREEKRLELPDIRLHDLRHGHGTALAENGVDPATISERLGHASVQFTFDTYVKPSAARQARAVDELEGRVFRKDSPTISLPSDGVDGSVARKTPGRSWGDRGSNPGPTDYESDMW